MKLSINNFFSKSDQIRKESADLVTFTEEILNGKLHFLCREIDYSLLLRLFTSTGFAKTFVRTLFNIEHFSFNSEHLSLPARNKF